MRLARAGVGLLAGLALAACATEPTVEEESEVAREIEQQVLREVAVVRDDPLTTYVETLGERVTEHLEPHAIQPTFRVVESDDINAAAHAGGLILVNTGLILQARNLSELAGVIAHEIGHVRLRHVAQNYAKARNAGLIHNILTGAGQVALGGLGGLAASALSGVTLSAYLNSFTREHEAEADLFAVRALYRAGIDPEGMVTMFETLQNTYGTGGTVPNFLRSHPTTSDRIAATRAAIAQLGPRDALQRDDNGRLEILQHRVRLLTGKKVHGMPQQEPQPK